MRVAIVKFSDLLDANGYLNLSASSHLHSTLYVDQEIKRTLSTLKTINQRLKNLLEKRAELEQAALAKGITLPGVDLEGLGPR